MFSVVRKAQGAAMAAATVDRHLQPTNAAVIHHWPPYGGGSGSVYSISVNAPLAHA